MIYTLKRRNVEKSFMVFEKNLIYDLRKKQLIISLTWVHHNSYNIDYLVNTPSNPEQ